MDLPKVLVQVLLLSGGFWITNGQDTQGEEYILAVAATTVTDSFQFNFVLDVVTGVEAANVTVKDVGEIFVPSFSTKGIEIPETLRTTNGIENKSVSVFISRAEASVTARQDYMQGFSLLPVSGLGRRYLVASGYKGYGDRYVLVITTHSKASDVNIVFHLEGSFTYDNKTYGDGDSLDMTLGKYQTFALRTIEDLTGTIVTSDETIAVFVGYYNQLIPIEHLGQEYVVSVPYDSVQASFMPPGSNTELPEFQLQIISEHSDAQIHFNDGSTVSVNNEGVYRRTVTANSTFHFTSTRPVLTTLDGVDMLIVPPIKVFTTSVPLYGDSFKVLTTRDAMISVRSATNPPSFSAESYSLDIPNSNYKLVDFKFQYLVYIISSPNSNFTVISEWNAFGPFLAGYRFQPLPTTTPPTTTTSSPQPTTTFTQTTSTTLTSSAPSTSTQRNPSGGEEYVLAAMANEYPIVLDIVAGVEAVDVTVRKVAQIVVPSFSTKGVQIPDGLRTTEGIENKTVSVFISSTEASITARQGYMQGFALFPVSGLGKRYVLPSRYILGGDSVFMIASHSKKARVNIRVGLAGQFTYLGNTHMHGNPLDITLEEYHTFTIRTNYDLIGTIIESDETIAVFIDNNNQLLPDEHIGQEYVVCVPHDDSQASDWIPQYELQIISNMYSTTIEFNDGTRDWTNTNGYYSRTVTANTTFHFTTSDTALTTLAYGGDLYIVPPVQLFTTSIPLYGDSFKVLTTRDAVISVRNSTNLLTENYSVEIPGTNYKVVDYKFKTSSVIIFSSFNAKFTIISEWNGFGAFFPGYSFQPLSTTTPPSTTTSPTSTTTASSIITTTTTPTSTTTVSSIITTTTKPTSTTTKVSSITTTTTTPTSTTTVSSIITTTTTPTSTTTVSSIITTTTTPTSTTTVSPTSTTTASQTSALQSSSPPLHHIGEDHLQESLQSRSSMEYMEQIIDEGKKRKKGMGSEEDSSFDLN